MGNGVIRGAALAAALAAAGGLAGCGEKCPSEPVAKVEDVQDCTAAPGTPVAMDVRLCPTCNQSGTTCEADVQGNTIQLDLVSEACEDVTSCPSPQPGACQLNPAPCRFTAPAEPGQYAVVVYDPQRNQLVQFASLEVVAGASSFCDFPRASSP